MQQTSQEIFERYEFVTEQTQELRNLLISIISKHAPKDNSSDCVSIEELPLESLYFLYENWLTSEQQVFDYGEALNMESKKNKLYKAVKKFIIKNQISCAEMIWQSDRISENSYEFIEKLCDIVGYVEEIE